MKRSHKKRGTRKEFVHKPCVYCKRPMLPTSFLDNPDPALRQQTITVEHIIPRSKGGSNDPENLTHACARCNVLRGTLDIEIFIMFSKHILEKHPDENTLILRSALQQFVTSLAEIAIRNRRESRNAILIAKLAIQDDRNRFKKGISK